MIKEILVSFVLGVIATVGAVILLVVFVFISPFLAAYLFCLWLGKKRREKQRTKPKLTSAPKKRKVSSAKKKKKIMIFGRRRFVLGARESRKEKRLRLRRLRAQSL